MKFITLLIMLFSAFHTNAQDAMGYMPPSYQMKAIQSLRTMDGAHYEFGKQYRILKVPKEGGLNLQQKTALNKLLNSCGDCQEVPQIGGGPVILVTPKPISIAPEFCKKYPGKFGCPK